MEQASAPLVCTLRKRCHTHARGRVLRVESPRECKPSLQLRKAGAQTSSTASSKMRKANQRKADVARAGMDQALQTSSQYRRGPADIATPGAYQTNRSD